MNRNKNTLRPSILFAGAILLSALMMNCSKKSTAPEQVVYPDTLSFRQDIHPLLVDNCAATGGCHQSGNPANGLDLETQFPTFQSNTRPQPDVIPEQPNNSVLYLVLLQDYDNIPRMPPSPKPLLSDEEIKAVQRWIQQGASITN